MTAQMNRRIENSKLALIMMSAPKLAVDHFTPVRPPMAATATIAEILAAKAKVN